MALRGHPSRPISSIERTIAHRLRDVIGVDREATMLSLARGDDTLSNYRRAICFRSSLATQLAKLHSGYVDVNVDAIEKWSGDATNVTLDLRQRAATLTRRII